MVRGSMRRTIHAFLAILVLATAGAGCAGGSQVTAAWRQPGYAGRNFEKVVVGVLSGHTETRRVIENATIGRLRERGVMGVAAVDLFPDGVPMDDPDLIRAKLKEAKVDGAISYRLMDRTERTKTVAPMVDHGGSNLPGASFYGYYTEFYEPVHRDASIDVVRTYVLECRLYVLDNDEVVSVKEITVDDPRNVSDVRDMTRLLVKAFFESGAMKVAR